MNFGHKSITFFGNYKLKTHVFVSKVTVAACPMSTSQILYEAG